LEDTGGATGGGGGGGGIDILVGFFSTFSTESTGGCGGGGDGRDSFVASSGVIGFLPSFGVEASISSSTSGTANIFFDSRYFIQNDMILFTRLILLLHLLSLFSRSLLF